jgi:GxxExxY protein
MPGTGHGRQSATSARRIRICIPSEAEVSHGGSEGTALIVEEAYRIHQKIGPGLFESVYEVVLANALSKRGLKISRQVVIPIRIDELQFDEGFRADLVVEDQVIVEIKSIERLAPVHKKQVLTYLKLSGIHVGLLINFGGELLKGNIERLVAGAAPDLKKVS